MIDYIGRHVKRFESGKAGSLSLSSCGYDWGISCGSYQLTLRWGNCINFLKKYFPSESASLYFSTHMKDFASKTWPGGAYCSSPEVVRSTWIRCYNTVGADKFFEYEHDYIKSQYYDVVKKLIKDYIDLDALNDRAYQECFWSWAVHRGPHGAKNEFLSVLEENGITISEIRGVQYIKLFDLIYDKRYATNSFERYGRGKDSEREALRPLLNTYDDEPETPTAPIDPPKEKADPIFNPIAGAVRIILRNDTLNIRSYPDFGDNVIGSLSYGDTCRVKAITEDGNWYALTDNGFISASKKYSQFYPDVIFQSAPSEQFPYLVRVSCDTANVYKDADFKSKVNCTVSKNGVYTIVSEKNGFGKLKSGAGWISLTDGSFKKLR